MAFFLYYTIKRTLGFMNRDHCRKYWKVGLLTCRDLTNRKRQGYFVFESRSSILSLSIHEHVRESSVVSATRSTHRIPRRYPRSNAKNFMESPGSARRTRTSHLSQLQSCILIQVIIQRSAGLIQFDQYSTTFGMDRTLSLVDGISYHRVEDSTTPRNILR